MVIYMFVSVNCRGVVERVFIFQMKHKSLSKSCTFTFSWLLFFWLNFLYPSWRHLVLNIKTTFRTAYRKWVWKVRIWSPLLMKFLMEKFIICAVNIPLAKILFPQNYIWADKCWLGLYLQSGLKLLNQIFKLCLKFH